METLDPAALRARHNETVELLFSLFDKLYEYDWRRTRVDTLAAPRGGVTLRHHYANQTWTLTRRSNVGGSEQVVTFTDRDALPSTGDLLSFAQTGLTW